MEKIKAKLKVWWVLFKNQRNKLLIKLLKRIATQVDEYVNESESFPPHPLEQATTFDISLAMHHKTIHYRFGGMEGIIITIEIDEVALIRHVFNTKLNQISLIPILAYGLNTDDIVILIGDRLPWLEKVSQ